MTKPIGSMTALVTPFKDGKLDLITYEKLIQRQIDNNIDGVVPVGTTGESATLNNNEHEDCIRVAVDVCKGTNTKVVAGAGSNNTNEAIEMVEFSQKIGADAVLIVTPYYNKPTQDGLYEHYKSISKNTTLPIITYNVPSRTGVDLSVDTMLKLFDEFDNIYSIKEATGDVSRSMELMNKREDLSLFCGDDAINYPLMMSGAKGVISVTSNILPDLISSLVNQINSNNIAKSKDINRELFEMNKILFCQSNPIPIKAAMYIAGLLPSLEYRLPLVPPNKTDYEKIKKVVEKYNIK
jgi:4-hydroxy-tetrahydrodipicolinate synthase